MKLLRNIIVAIFLFSLTANVYTVSTENIVVKNDEDARLAYSVALYHRDQAISKFSNNEDGTDDIERSNEILKDILKFNTIEEVYTTLSENYELLGDYKNLVKTFEDILKNEPYNVDVLIKLAQKYFFILQDYAKSEYYIKKAFELDPYNNNVLLLLGYINYDKYKDYVKACYYFSKIDESKGFNTEFNLIDYNIYYSLAAFYNGMFTLAKDRMLKVSSNELRAKTYLYNVITKSSQVLEDYKNAYSVALQVYAETEDEESLYYAAFLSAITDKYNEDLFSRISKARRKAPKIIEIASMLNDTNNIKPAIKELESEFEKGNFDLDLIQLYYHLIMKGEDKAAILEAEKLITDFYLSLGAYESLKSHLYYIAKESVVEEDAAIVLAMYVKMINGLYNNNDYENANNAIKDYLEILDLYKYTNIDYYMYIVRTLYAINEYDASLQVLDTLTNFEQEQLSKNKYDSYKAYIYSLKKDKENTIKYINSYIDYATSNPNKENITDLNLLYMASYNIRDKVLVEKLARMIYSLDNTSTMAKNAMAWALIDLEIDVDEGMKIEKEALKLEPKNVYYLDTLAWGHYKKGEYEEAIKILLNVLFNIDDSNIEANIEIFTHTADTYYALKNEDMALTYYLKARAYMFDKESEYREHVDNMIKQLREKP